MYLGVWLRSVPWAVGQHEAVLDVKLKAKRTLDVGSVCVPVSAPLLFPVSYPLLLSVRRFIRLSVGEPVLNPVAEPALSPVVMPVRSDIAFPILIPVGNSVVLPLLLPVALPTVSPMRIPMMSPVRCLPSAQQPVKGTRKAGAGRLDCCIVLGGLVRHSSGSRKSVQTQSTDLSNLTGSVQPARRNRLSVAA
jgi:hypothetical protein